MLLLSDVYFENPKSGKAAFSCLKRRCGNSSSHPSMATFKLCIKSNKFAFYTSA